MNSLHLEPWIFLSYRRGSSGGSWAARQVATALESYCGERSIFYDTRSIKPSTLWDAEIIKTLEACRAFVVLIDSSWESPRLADPADWVRREIEFAIHQRMLMVPIVLDRAGTPNIAGLPASIAPLARIQAFFVDGRSDGIFQASMKVVAEHILNTTQSQVELTRAPASWWDRIALNCWTLYLDNQSLLSLHGTETSASAAVATGPHLLRVEWSEAAQDSGYGQGRCAGRSSRGTTEDQKAVLRPGKYELSLVPGLDTRSLPQKFWDRWGLTDSLSRRIHVIHHPAPKANSSAPHE